MCRQSPALNMPQPRVKLVVTGDDFGYCARRNRGIAEAFLAGGISNASVLVNGASADHAAQLAKRHCIPIGLHANLSEGAPVCRELRRSTLLNNDGFFHGKMGFREVLRSGKMSMTDVEVELRAQVKHFCELTGHLPNHMDGHQHVHVLPEVREVFARFSLILASLTHGSQWSLVYIPVISCLRASENSTCRLRKTLQSVEVFHRHGIRWPDVYLGLSTMGQNMSFSNLKRALTFALEARTSITAQADGHCAPESYRPITAELMVHPGYPSFPLQGGCGEGPDDFSQSSDRLHELKTLRDPVLLSYYQQQRILLCAFNDF